MTANTSASGGYLQPTSPILSEDLVLDEVLQGVVVGITGLDGALVRPRWQPIMAPEPTRDTDWCAIGVTDEAPETNATVRHFPGTTEDYWDRTDPPSKGFNQSLRQVVLTIMASFYGPNSRGLANKLNDGLYISQNREVMVLRGMAFIDITRIANAPEMINNVWRARTDLTFRIRRAIMRTYAVENILESTGTVQEANVNGELWGSEPFDTDNARE